MLSQGVLNHFQVNSDRVALVFVDFLNDHV